ncbi:MAG: hypothetical protein KAT70_00220 [Thermoplasmata archaeon]|nr:hypothetical protein [Thermoplasmata archaeon]
MNLYLLYTDIKNILSSKRTSYTILIMAVFALVFGLVIRFSSEGLRTALEASAPGSAGVFEYMWFEDVLKFLLLVVVSFGAFIISDLEDDGTLGLILARPESRIAFLVRRILASLGAFFIVFMAGAVLVGIIAIGIMGDLDLPLFLLHQFFALPLCLFVIALAFFLSVPLRTTTYTVISSFAISLILSFTYAFSLMTGSGTPSPLNPLALGYRILVNAPLVEPMIYAFVFSAVLFAAGTVWFVKKDI